MCLASDPGLCTSDKHIAQVRRTAIASCLATSAPSHKQFHLQSCWSVTAETKAARVTLACGGPEQCPIQRIVVRLAPKVSNNVTLLRRHYHSTIHYPLSPHPIAIYALGAASNRPRGIPAGLNRIQTADWIGSRQLPVKPSSNCGNLAQWPVGMHSFQGNHTHHNALIIGQT